MKLLSRFKDMATGKDLARESYFGSATDRQHQKESRAQDSTDDDVDELKWVNESGVSNSLMAREFLNRPPELINQNEVKNLISELTKSVEKEEEDLMSNFDNKNATNPQEILQLLNE